MGLSLTLEGGHTHERGAYDTRLLQLTPSLDSFCLYMHLVLGMFQGRTWPGAAVAANAELMSMSSPLYLTICCRMTRCMTACEQGAVCIPIAGKIP